jgi:hypothetical protein
MDERVRFTALELHIGRSTVQKFLERAKKLKRQRLTACSFWNKLLFLMKINLWGDFMKLDTTTLTVIVSICVALLTIIGNFIVTIITRRYEYKKAITTVLYDTAYIEWESKTKLVREISKESGMPFTIVSYTEQ